MKNNNIERPYQICTSCVMDTSDTNILFDNKGICNHCYNRIREIDKKVLSGLEGEQKLTEIVNKLKKDGEGHQYDCVIGVSGGVDSTYVAYKVKQLGLRPLAVHLDNGWDSELAVKNIENICRKLDIDLHTIVLDWQEFRDLQISFLRASTPDSEIPSDHAIVASMLKTAKMVKTKYIIAGYNVKTETHLPAEWSQGHFDWGYIKTIQEKFGTVKLKSFPHLNLINFIFSTYNNSFINILNYIDFSKKDAMPILENEIDWKYYGGKHYESIYTRWFQGYWLPTKFGYDKRRSHLSSQVCSGEITRDEALEELKLNPYSGDLQKEDTEYVLKKFNLSSEQLNDIMKLPKKSYWDYRSYGQIYKTRLYSVLKTIYRTFIKN